MSNPFKYGTVVSGKDFADRQKELKELSAKLKDPVRIFLLAPRRYGKTSLIENDFAKPGACVPHAVGRTHHSSTKNDKGGSTTQGPAVDREGFHSAIKFGVGLQCIQKPEGASIQRYPPKRKRILCF